MATLRLTATEVVGDRRSWLWRLFDGDRFVGQHVVGVEGSPWEWAALQDLDRQIARLAVPDDRLRSEERLLAQVGAWTATFVLGSLADSLRKAAPVTVVVEVPVEAAWLAGLPLGVAVVNGKPLGLSRVGFVNTVSGEEVVDKDPVGERVRVLAVFSVPAGQALLDLRRERFELQRLVRDLCGGGDRRGIELRVVQYGADRQRVQDLLGQEAGWDVVHFSGHGSPGRIVLETATGESDLVEADTLVDWLVEARRRVKLVSLSACSSAAFTVAETLKAMHVDAAAAVADANGDGDGSGDGLGGLAETLVERLGCTVVGMRYPVVDDFAIDLTTRFYRELLSQGRPVAAALEAATRATVKTPATAGAPALSLATPAVFGRTGVELRLQPPTGVATPPDVRMAGVPDERERFVGRTAIMTRAHAAMAPHSGRSGVVFHGMAGAGKSSCALELAYGQHTNFQEVVWFECPPEDAPDDTVDAALTRFAGRLDLALGVAIVDKTTTLERLATVLPIATQVMKDRAILVIVDNAESLLTPAGAWLDPRRDSS